MYYGLVYNRFLTQDLRKERQELEPLETYVRVACADKEEDFDSYWFKDGKGHLWGQLGHCSELIFWASGGLYWTKDLREANENKTLNGPTEFTVHIWKQIDEYNLNSVFDLTFKGVKWESVKHADDNGASDCWGLATFTYTEKIRNENYQAMECHIPQTETQYPTLSYSKLMPRFLTSLAFSEGESI